MTTGSGAEADSPADPSADASADPSADSSADRSADLRARLTGPAVRVAPRLLGAVVTSEVGGERVLLRVTEVEAYEGADDPASHAYRGPTRRTAVMFGPPGHLYCYFTYGLHWCANVVCGVDGVAAAVLLRAGEILDGRETARARRPAARRDADLARGPARLATCLGLDANHNGIDLLAGSSPVRLMSARSGRGRRTARIEQGPRVGISTATDRPWRFWLPDEPSVSAFRAGARPRDARAPAD